MRKAIILLHTILCLLLGFAIGHQYAVRNNEVLVAFTESNVASDAALRNFQRVLEETDFCDGGSNGAQ